MCWLDNQLLLLNRRSDTPAQNTFIPYFGVFSFVYQEIVAAVHNYIKNAKQLLLFGGWPYFY